jgi:hypothetical protein
MASTIFLFLAWSDATVRRGLHDDEPKQHEGKPCNLDVAAIDLAGQCDQLGKFVFHVEIPFFVLVECANNTSPQAAKQAAKLLLSRTPKPRYCVNSP